VMETEPAIVFFDMPLPGSFAAQPFLKGEDDKYKAGQVLGLVCVDTVGGDYHRVLTEDDKEILADMGRVAGSTYERLVEEARLRKVAEDQAVAELFGALVISEDQALTDEDEVDAIEAKLAALDTELVAKVKGVIKEHCPHSAVGEYGRSISEYAGYAAHTPSARAVAAVMILVGATAEQTAEELEGAIQAFDIKTVKEGALAACSAALDPDGAEPLTKDSPDVTFPAQLGLALITVAKLLSPISLKAQKIRAEEEEARLAEIQKQKEAEEAAAAAAAAPAE